MTALRRLAALALLLVLAALGPVPGAATLAPAATPDAAGGAEEIVLWHAYRGQEQAALEKAAALFAERSGGRYRVRVAASPYDRFADKISASIPVGAGPDLFIFSHDRLGGWMEAGGILEPLDFWLQEDGLDRFVPATVPAMRYRGQTFGIPFKFAVIAMLYNRALVDSPPATTGELVAWARTRTDPGTGRFGWAYLYDSPFLHSALVNAFGGHYFDPAAGGTLIPPTLTAEGNIRAAQQLADWVLRDGVLPTEPDGALITGMFNQGKVGIIFNGPWFFGEVAPDLDVGIAPLPRLDAAGGTPLKPWMTVEGLFISARSPRQDAAMELARFLTTPEVARIMALEGRQLPALAAVYDDPDVAADPILTGFRIQAESAVPSPNLAVMTLLWAPLELALKQVIKGTATPEQAMADVQARVTADITALRRRN